MFFVEKENEKTIGKVGKVGKEAEVKEGEQEKEGEVRVEEEKGKQEEQEEGKEGENEGGRKRTRRRKERKGNEKEGKGEKRAEKGEGEEPLQHFPFAVSCSFAVKRLQLVSKMSGGVKGQRSGRGKTADQLAHFKEAPTLEATGGCSNYCFSCFFIRIEKNNTFIV